MAFERNDAVAKDEIKVVRTIPKRKHPEPFEDSTGAKDETTNVTSSSSTTMDDYVTKDVVLHTKRKSSFAIQGYSSNHSLWEEKPHPNEKTGGRNQNSMSFTQVSKQLANLDMGGLALFTPVLCEPELVCGPELGSLRGIRSGLRDDDTTWTEYSLLNEAEQVQRMSTWNTMSTASSYQTRQSQPDTTTAGRRSVNFTYPPVSAVKQVPRHRTKDRPNLFFTEEELDQAENDRSIAHFSDDIECIHVTSRTWTDTLRHCPDGSDKILVRSSPQMAWDQTLHSHRSMCETTTDLFRNGFRGMLRCTNSSHLGKEERKLSMENKSSEKRVQLCLRERSRGGPSPNPSTAISDRSKP